MRRVRRFFSHWQNILGFLIILFFVVIAVMAPVLSPNDPNDPSAFKKVGHTHLETFKPEPHPPSDIALLGTLPQQYDVFHTLVWGTRDALQFGLLVVLFSGAFGVIFGAVAGYAGGRVNRVMMRISDSFLAFPVIASVVFLQQLMAIAIQSSGGTFFFNTQNFGRIVDIVGSPSLIQVLLGAVNPLMLSLILFSWMPYARLVNTTVISIKNTDFIQASRALGANPLYTVFKHLIPNSVAPSIVLMARDVGSVVILQATLTFIHLGGDSPWGEMLSIGRNWIIGPGGGLFTYWWVFMPATLAIMLFGIGWNLLGDGLVELFDPRSY